MPDPAPAGPTRSLVRPRIASGAIIALIAFIGIGLLSTGSGVGIAVGVFLLAVAVFGVVSLATTRVWIEGDLLHVRAPLRGREPVRLDRLTHASLSGWGQGKGPELALSDSEGAHVLLDATNFRLDELYAELAARLPASDRDGFGRSIADDRVHARLELHRGRGRP